MAQSRVVITIGLKHHIMFLKTIFQSFHGIKYFGVSGLYAVAKKETEELSMRAQATVKVFCSRDRSMTLRLEDTGEAFKFAVFSVKTITASNTIEIIDQKDLFIRYFVKRAKFQ